MNAPTSLQPFIPGGANFAQSQALFLALGCETLWSSEGYAGLRWGAARFILQALNDLHFASNLMIRIDVPDLDAWWVEVQGLELPRRFPGFRINPPKQFPWGREVHFIDLAGVCWHVGTEP